MLVFFIEPFKAPKNVRAEVLNSTAIHVKWQAPSAPFGAKLLGYIVYYRRFDKDTNMETTNTWGNKVVRIMLTRIIALSELEKSFLVIYSIILVIRVVLNDISILSFCETFLQQSKGFIEGKIFRFYFFHNFVRVVVAHYHFLLR